MKSPESTFETSSSGSVVNNVYHNNKGPPFFFIMMRLNLKMALLCLCVAVSFITLSLWARCGHSSHQFGKIYLNGDREGELQELREIDCDINGEYVVACRKEGDEVYVPFSFLHKYFEVYGRFGTYEGSAKFEWSHSYSKIYHPKGKYDPTGVFMYFENYNVEVRDRVKCISAMEGVPISTQWEIQGYFYPTQIAQFGLSHYSKNLTEPEPRRRVLEDGEGVAADWVVPESCAFNRVVDGKSGSHVFKFATPDDKGDVVRLSLEHVFDFVMSVDVLLKGNSSLGVLLQNRETKEVFVLYYTTSDVILSTQDNNIYYGMGASNEWKKLTRDLVVDLQKGLHYLDKSRHKLPRSRLKILRLILKGHGSIDNLTISSSEHMRQFYSSAEWFVRNQNPQTGGWPISVKRKLANGFGDLQPGWYSAMGQGHAISLLSRAYHHSGGDTRYLTSAIRGLKPFTVESADGGVLSRLLGRLPWYEEYPTNPPSFVLNGFIYSLIGLYDLMSVAPAGRDGGAGKLYADGVGSLKAMLTLYDMGSVTAYDLRHFTLGVAPNLARWDYHATHINQLLLLGTIENEGLFVDTAERWIGYMSGKRAAHN